MYNRYIPQPDGSYSRCRIPDRGQPKQATQSHWNPAPARCEMPQEPERKPTPPLKPTPKSGSGNPRRPHPAPPRRPRESSPEPGGNVLDFFRRFLPTDFDTGDLLIILLLLLMAGDCQEEQNSALLTLALYLFL